VDASDTKAHRKRPLEGQPKGSQACARHVSALPPSFDATNIKEGQKQNYFIISALHSSDQMNIRRVTLITDQYFGMYSSSVAFRTCY
jgi:hypothetical protein